MDIKERLKDVWHLLDQKDRDILLVLDSHRGMKNAIHQKDLSARVNLPTRKIQERLPRLVLEFGAPIATSLPCGHFLIETPEEAEAVAAHHRARAISGLIHAQAVRRIRKVDFEAELAAAAGQRRLFDE